MVDGLRPADRRDAVASASLRRSVAFDTIGDLPSRAFLRDFGFELRDHGVGGVLHADARWWLAVAIALS